MARHRLLHTVGREDADPEDTGMMDVVGFDSAAPQVISDFARTACRSVSIHT